MIKIKEYQIGKHKEWIDCLIKSYIMDLQIPKSYKVEYCKILPASEQGKIFEQTVEKRFVSYLKEERKAQEEFSKSGEIKKLKSQLERLWSFGYTILPHELQEFRKNKTLKLF